MNMRGRTRPAGGAPSTGEREWEWESGSGRARERELGAGVGASASAWARTGAEAGAEAGRQGLEGVAGSGAAAATSRGGTHSSE